MAVFAAIPALPEAKRWAAAFTDGAACLRSPGEPDILITPGEGLSLVTAAGTGPAAQMTAADRLLVRWGRCPARLRRGSGGPETIDGILARLFGRTGMNI